MAAKKCPNCNSECPVASNSCKKCLHVFKSRKGSSTSSTASLSPKQSTTVTVGNTTAASRHSDEAMNEIQGRRHTGRITRSKPNFYDSLHVEEQMKQDDEKFKPDGSDRNEMKKIFVTVGTTSFEALVQEVQTTKILKTLKALGVEQVRVQAGNSRIGQGEYILSDIKFVVFKYKPGLEDDMRWADLIISHAGAGTTLDALNLRKRLIVIPNTQLMDNHQFELADFLSSRNYVYSSTVETLSETLHEIGKSPQILEPFITEKCPSFDEFLKKELNLDPVKIRQLENQYHNYTNGHDDLITSSALSVKPIWFIVFLIVPFLFWTIQSLITRS